MLDSDTLNEYIMSFEEDLEKVYNYLKGEFSTIRAGRVSPHILDKVKVDYYGVSTPINQMSNISAPEARMITISVWDISQTQAIVKALIEADLGVMPTDDGKIIRLNFPALTQEKRKDLVKQIKKITEDAKVSMRNARRDILDVFKKMKKDNEISEDELTNIENDVQKILDKNIKILEELYAKKEKEVITV